MLPFPREIGLKRQQCTDYQAFCDYIKTLNGKTSLYTSLYSFTSTKYDKPWRYDYTTAIIDKAWWDFDTTEQYGIERVKEDVAQLIRRLVGDIRVVATGRLWMASAFPRNLFASLEHTTQSEANGLSLLNRMFLLITHYPMTFLIIRTIFTNARFWAFLRAQNRLIWFCGCMITQSKQSPQKAFLWLSPPTPKQLTILLYRHASETTLYQTTHHTSRGWPWFSFYPKNCVGIRTNMKYKQSPTCRAFSSRNMCASKCWKYDGTF